MCNQSPGMGQYGSSAGARPAMMNMGGFQQTNQNPILNSAMSYGGERARLMPGFRGYGVGGGQFGASQSGAWPMDSSGNPLSGSTPDPLRPIGNLRGPDGISMNSPPPQMPQMPQQAASVATPGYVFGKAAPMPFNDAPAVSSPASVFGKAAPMPYQDTAPQQPVAQPRADAFSNSMLYANPMGLSQAQLGPSFNPAGSPMGGYFQGNRYVPNAGNMRNGLDALARFGMGINGTGY